VTDAESRFVARVLRRKRLFLALSIGGLAIAALLSIYYVYRVVHDPDFPIGPRAVIVLLILLNARQNLRQYRYAGVLEQLMPGPAGSPRTGLD
jgi:hypothetical protein